MRSVESRIAFPNEALSDHIIPNDIRKISINELKPNCPAAILFRFLSGIFSWNNWFTVRSNDKTAHRCRTIDTNINPRLLFVPENHSTIKVPFSCGLALKQTRFFWNGSQSGITLFKKVLSNLKLLYLKKILPINILTQTLFVWRCFDSNFKECKEVLNVTKQMTEDYIKDS